MLLLWRCLAIYLLGHKKFAVKTYHHHEEPCSKCGHADMKIKVYHGYFHILFIPCWPTNNRTSTLQCHHCGRRTRFDSIQYHYEKKTPKPFYLYTGLVLLVCGLLYLSVRTPADQPESPSANAKAIRTPQEGDMYAISKDIEGRTLFYFTRIVMVKGDSLYLQHSNRIYDSRNAKPNQEDHFVEGDELIMPRATLLQRIGTGDMILVENN